MTDEVTAVQESTPEALSPEQSQQVETIPENTTTPEQSSHEDPADDAAAEAKKHKGGFQRRIDELTRQREEERREKERLLAVVEHLTGRNGEQPGSKQASQDAEPKRDSFDSYEDYLEARAVWSAEQATAKRLADIERAQEEKSRRATQEQRVREWSAKIETAREKYADFDEVTATADVPVTPAMSEAIMESDIGPELAYYLGKNPAEARRIALLSPLSQAREIGRLENKVATPAKASSAPAPIKPVGTRSVGGDPLADNVPIGQWAENFRKQFYKGR